MALRLKAVVKTSTGKTQHGLGTLVSGTPVEVARFPTPSWVEIVEEDGAFYLLYFNAEGICLTDTWHQTLEAAKHQAEFEFGISVSDWDEMI